MPEQVASHPPPEVLHAIGMVERVQHKFAVDRASRRGPSGKSIHDAANYLVPLDPFGVRAKRHRSLYYDFEEFHSLFVRSKLGGYLRVLPGGP